MTAQVFLIYGLNDEGYPVGLPVAICSSRHKAENLIIELEGAEKRGYVAPSTSTHSKFGIREQTIDMASLTNHSTGLHEDITIG
jgi:hypothetical protein